MTKTFALLSSKRNASCTKGPCIVTITISTEPSLKGTATLTEYVVTVTEEFGPPSICRVYKNENGVWYDPMFFVNLGDPETVREIKQTIDSLDY